MVRSHRRSPELRKRSIHELFRVAQSDDYAAIANVGAAGVRAAIAPHAYADEQLRTDFPAAFLERTVISYVDNPDFVAEAVHGLLCGAPWLPTQAAMKGAVLSHAATSLQMKFARPWFLPPQEHSQFIVRPLAFMQRASHSCLEGFDL